MVIAANSMYSYASFRYRNVNIERFSGQVNIGHAFPVTGTVRFDFSTQEIATIAQDVSVINFALFDENMEFTDEDRCVHVHVKYTVTSSF